MPCYSENIFSVEFKAANQGVLERACAALGFTLIGRVVHTPNGEFVLTDEEAQGDRYVLPAINRLRVQYSKEAVNTVAGRLGWQKVAKSANKFLLSKGM